MGIHPKDLFADNPRMQCIVCGKWKRMIVNGEQLFFGGCCYNKGGNHLAQKNGDDYVCEPCCQIECKRLAAPPVSKGEAT